MVKSVVIACLTLFLVGAGLSAPASAASRPAVTSLKASTVEQGKKAVLTGKVVRARKGTKVTLQVRRSAKYNWVKARTATVRSSGRFTARLTTRSAGKLTYRVCIGTGKAKRCSSSVRHTVIKPDGDVRVASWSGVTAPAESPVTARFGVDEAPLTVSGTSDPRWRSALMNDGLGVEQLKDGAWSRLYGAVAVDASGAWTFTGAMQAVGQRQAPLRVVTGPGTTGSILRSTVVRQFTTTSYKDIRVQDLALTSGALAYRTFTTLDGVLVKTSSTTSPVGDSSASFSLGGSCIRLFHRVGLAPEGAQTDQMQAEIAVDGATVVSESVGPTPSGPYGGPAAERDISGAGSLTLSDRTTGSTGSDVWFDAFVRCTS